MGVPIRQQIAVGKYILEQKLRRNERYPMVLMLEPLFRCNLACAGCGKIDYPDDILNRRMTVDQALAAADECGAPIVSIAGGEPLVHRELPEIVAGMIERKKFVYLCTNALLLEKKMDRFPPSPHLSFSVHLDGNRERHDASVCQPGVFDRAVRAIDVALKRGYRVTVNCTLFQGEAAAEVAEFFDFLTDLGIEGITVSPGFSYSHAPKQDVFLKRGQTKQLFRDIFRLGKERRWPLNHSILYLDFLAGNQTYQCTAWGNPTYNVFGWQKPCYLLLDEGYAESFQELIDDTDWSSYGTGRNPKCANCMAHCGYEPSAVNDAVARPLKALLTSLRGPRTEGDMAPELPVCYDDRPLTDSPPSLPVLDRNVSRHSAD